MAINVEYPFMFGNRQHVLDGLVPWEVGQQLSFANGIWHYTEPFRLYTGPKVAGNAGGWLVTEVDGGGDAAQGVTLLDDAPGVLQIASNDAENDACCLQKLGEHYKYVAGKMSYFIACVALTDVDDGEAHFGLNIADTSPIASAPSDGFFFAKAEIATAMTFHARKNGNSTTVAVDPTAMADSTFRWYGFYVLGNGTVYVLYGTTWENVAVIGTVAAGNANICDDEALAVHFSIMTGAADVDAMLVKGFSVGRAL
jgi:hypothetical protein